MFPLFNLFLSSKLYSYFRIEFYFSWDCFKWLKWLFPTSSPGIQRKKKPLLRFTYQQIIYLVCTTTKSRETDSQPDTLKKKRERVRTIWVVPKPDSLVKIWVNVPILKFLFVFFFPRVWNLAWYNYFKPKTETSVFFPFLLYPVTEVGGWSCHSSCYFGRKNGSNIGSV